MISLFTGEANQANETIKSAAAIVFEGIFIYLSNCICMYRDWCAVWEGLAERQDRAGEKAFQ